MQRFVLVHMHSTMFYVHCCSCHNFVQRCVGWTVDVVRNVCFCHGVFGKGQGQGELQEHLAKMVVFGPVDGQRCLQNDGWGWWFHFVESVSLFYRSKTLCKSVLQSHNVVVLKKIRIGRIKWADIDYQFPGQRVKMVEDTCHIRMNETRTISIPQYVNPARGDASRVHCGNAWKSHVSIKRSMCLAAWSNSLIL